MVGNLENVNKLNGENKNCPWSCYPEIYTLSNVVKKILGEGLANSRNQCSPFKKKIIFVLRIMGCPMEPKLRKGWEPRSRTPVHSSFSRAFLPPCKNYLFCIIKWNLFLVGNKIQFGLFCYLEYSPVYSICSVQTSALLGLCSLLTTLFKPGVDLEIPVADVFCPLHCWLALAFLSQGRRWCMLVMLPGVRLLSLQCGDQEGTRSAAESSCRGQHSSRYGVAAIVNWLLKWSVPSLPTCLPGPKQQKCIVGQSWRPEAWGQSACRVDCVPRLSGRLCNTSLLSFWTFASNHWHPLLWRSSTLISIFIFTRCSAKVHVCVQIPPFY